MQADLRVPPTLLLVLLFAAIVVVISGMLVGRLGVGEARFVESCGWRVVIVEVLGGSD